MSRLPEVSFYWEGEEFLHVESNKELAETDSATLEMLDDVICRAIESNNAKAVNTAIKHGYNVRNKIVGTEERLRWYTHAYSACCKGRVNITSIIMGAGIAVDDTIAIDETNMKVTMLRAAIEFDQLDMVKYLLGRGANPNLNLYVNPDIYITPLMYASTRSTNIEIIKEMLNHGGHFHAMIYAAERGQCNPAVYECFLKAGADPYMLGPNNLTALQELQQDACTCDNLKKSIALLKKAMTLKISSKPIVLKNIDTECFCCANSVKSDWCRFQCCRQLIHVKCLQQWHDTGMENAKQCPLCRATVREVDICKRPWWMHPTV